MVSRKAVAVLLMVHVAVMLASQTEAFVPIFTHSELQRIRVGNLPGCLPPQRGPSDSQLLSAEVVLVSLRHKCPWGETHV